MGHGHGARVVPAIFGSFLGQFRALFGHAQRRKSMLDTFCPELGHIRPNSGPLLGQRPCQAPSGGNFAAPDRNQVVSAAILGPFLVTF